MAKTLPLNNDRHAIVDDEDYAWLSRWKWSYMTVGYASRRIGGQMVYMHRLIMRAKPGQLVDHINGDTLDNRKSNLRYATKSQNAINSFKERTPCSSKYKGVYWDKRCSKWHAHIKIGGKLTFLGRFVNETDAAIAYDTAAREHFGTFARFNFPQPGEQGV